MVINYAGRVLAGARVRSEPEVLSYFRREEILHFQIRLCLSVCGAANAAAG